MNPKLWETTPLLAGIAGVSRDFEVSATSVLDEVAHRLSLQIPATVRLDTFAQRRATPLSRLSLAVVDDNPEIRGRVNAAADRILPEVSLSPVPPSAKSLIASYYSKEKGEVIEWEVKHAREQAPGGTIGCVAGYVRDEPVREFSGLWEPRQFNAAAASEFWPGCIDGTTRMWATAAGAYLFDSSFRLGISMDIPTGAAIPTAGVFDRAVVTVPAQMEPGLVACDPVAVSVPEIPQPIVLRPTTWGVRLLSGKYLGADGEYIARLAAFIGLAHGYVSHIPNVAVVLATSIWEQSREHCQELFGVLR